MDDNWDGSDLFDDIFPDENDERQPLGPEDRNGYAHYENVECVHETDMAIICLVDNKRRVIPKSQVHARKGAVHEKGDKGELVIRSWFANKMEYEQVEEDAGPVTVTDAVVLREARSGKAIEVRLPDGSEVWIPVNQLVDGNECRYDGDMGKLVVTSWIAEQKGIRGD